MSFIERSESLRSKLHLTDAKTSSIVGVCCAVLAVIALVVFGIANLAGSDPVEIVKAEEPSPEASAGEGGEAQALESAGVFVHVTGAVVEPGMYELPAGSRVHDAIAAAGGYSEEAAESVLNLARSVSDGEQIVVPAEGDIASPNASSDGGSGGTSPSDGGSFAQSGGIIGGKVNINAATAQELDTLPGIGAATAEKIVADREANGPFASIDDIQRVSGIGAKKYAQLADLICIG